MGGIATVSIYLLCVAVVLFIICLVGAKNHNIPDEED